MKQEVSVRSGSLDQKTIKEFPWGEVITVHTIGNVDVLEYFDRKRDGVTITRQIDYNTKSYHAYLDGKSINQSFSTLDQAVIGALCHKYDGYNSRAAYYIFAMIGMIDKN